MNSISEFSTNIIQSINNIAEKEGYLNYKIHIQYNSGTGGNYFGQIYQVDITGETKDGNKETNLFVKINNGSEDTTFLSMDGVYRTELFAYKELSEIFADLQEDANVPLHERYKMAKFYDESTTEAIILENIARKGFKTYDRMEVVNLQFAEMSIKELAKLHALSFVLEERRPEYFNMKIKGIKFALTFGDNWFKFVKRMMKFTIQNLDSDVKDRVENTYNKLSYKYPQYFNDETTKRCLCHGDYKAGNVMMKINNEQLSCIIPVDYQFLHYGCPVLDFIYLIFLSTDRKLRDAHLQHLKDLYHESLGTFLEYFNMNVEQVYPKKMFDEDYNEKLDYALLFGYVLMPLMLVPNGSVPDLTGELSDISFEVSDEYKARQRDMIEEFIEWGYIV